MKHLVAKAVLAATAAAAMVPAQALVVGSADAGQSNSLPFDTYLGGAYYQQVYGSAAFSSAFDVSNLTFYTSQSPGGATDGGHFRILLSTTNATIPTFSSNNVAFPDASFTTVFDNLIPALSGGKLVFDLSSAFHYDPTAGNLLLTIVNLDLSGNGNLFLDVDKNNPLTNSRFSAYNAGTTGGGWNQGLVTGFNEQVAPVPLPAGLPLMVSGLAALGGMLRRRRMPG